MMNEKETSFKQTIIDLVDELRSFKYALSTWQDELNEYKEKTAELNQIFLKLGQLSDLQFKEQNKIFQDLWIKLLTIASYMDNKIEKLCSVVENKILNVITSLSTSLEKLDNNQYTTTEALKKIVNEQVKTNGLLQDVKVLLQQQLEIKKQTALESAKLKKKIEKEIGE
jgi:predicted RecB family endonuclease